MYFVKSFRGKIDTILFDYNEFLDQNQDIHVVSTCITQDFNSHVSNFEEAFILVATFCKVFVVTFPNTANTSNYKSPVIDSTIPDSGKKIKKKWWQL